MGWGGICYHVAFHGSVFLRALWEQGRLEEKKNGGPSWRLRVGALRTARRAVRMCRSVELHASHT